MRVTNVLRFSDDKPRAGVVSSFGRCSQVSLLQFNKLEPTIDACNLFRAVRLLFNCSHFRFYFVVWNSKAEKERR